MAALNIISEVLGNAIELEKFWKALQKLKKQKVTFFNQICYLPPLAQES